MKGEDGAVEEASLENVREMNRALKAFRDPLPASAPQEPRAPALSVIDKKAIQERVRRDMQKKSATGQPKKKESARNKNKERTSREGKDAAKNHSYD